MQAAIETKKDRRVAALRDRGKSAEGEGGDKDKGERGWGERNGGGTSWKRGFLLCSGREAKSGENESGNGDGRGGGVRVAHAKRGGETWVRA